MNKARVKLFLFVLGTFLVQTTYGQRNFEPGYIITLNGDTINGFIDNRNKEKNISRLFFKEEASGQVISYSPTEIKRFKVMDEVYVSAVVLIDDSPVKDEELTFSKEFNLKEDTVFLRILIEGEKSLFYYQDERWRAHFFIRQGDALERLIYKRYLVYEDGVKKIRTNKSYLGQLSLYFHDCPSVQLKLSRLQYNRRDLVDIFKDYYGCTNSEIAFQQKDENLRTEFGVLAGVTSTKLQFRSKLSKSENEHLTNVDFDRSTDLTAGIFFNFVLPRNRRRWLIHNELLFNSFKTNGEYKASSDYESTKVKTTLNYQYVKLNNMVCYKYPVQRMHFFINAGISNGIVVKEVNSMEKESKVYSKVNVYHADAIKYTTKLEQGVLLGLGSQFRKFSLEARYEGGTGMSATMGLISGTRRFYFLLGYSL